MVICLIYTHVTPLILSIKHGHYDTYVLIEHGATDKNGEALLFAAEYGHTRICELLLDSGYDPMGNYWCDYEEGTPLHMAVKHRRYDICKLLIDSGADKYVYEMYGSYRTPLHIAVEEGYMDICKLFIEAGMNPDGECLPL